ncbi:MAG: N-acetyltransferase [Bacteroidales bacterium]|nr:N-acetyltransferase [Bacteroidales bacterium]
MELPAGLIIRPELSGDYAKITRLNDLAFGQPGEGKLIEALRLNPLFIKGLSLVAIIRGEIVGHILFSPVLIRSENKVFRSLALAPMSVLPGFQGKGIGSALISAGLDEAKAGKFDSVIVLGHRDYYPRFGFKPASRFGIVPPFEVPDDVFFAMELRPDGLSGVTGVVEYPGEFAFGLAKTAG